MGKSVKARGACWRIILCLAWRWILHHALDALLLDKQMDGSCLQALVSLLPLWKCLPACMHDQSLKAASSRVQHADVGAGAT